MPSHVWTPGSCSLLNLPLKIKNGTKLFWFVDYEEWNEANETALISWNFGTEWRKWRRFVICRVIQSGIIGTGLLPISHEWLQLRTKLIEYPHTNSKWQCEHFARFNWKRLRYLLSLDFHSNECIGDEFYIANETGGRVQCEAQRDGVCVLFVALVDLFLGVYLACYAVVFLFC